MSPQQTAPDETQYISFSAQVNPKTTMSLLALCAKLANEGAKRIYLILSTPGGQVMSGITAYNVLRSMPFHLTTHNAGAVDSIGNVIFLAGEERYACRNSSFKFHGVGFDIVNQVIRFDRKTLIERLDSVEADERKIGSIISERTKLSDGEVSELFLQAQTRDPDFACSKGIIHEVRDVEIPSGAQIHQLVFES